MRGGPVCGLPVAISVCTSGQRAALPWDRFFALGQVRRQGFWLPGKEGVVQRLETQTEGLLSSQFLPLAPWATHLGKSGQPAPHPHASFPVFLK